MVTTPLWAYAVLVIAVLAMSSGGVWFALLTETPPLMQACWRLLLTVVLQCIGFLYELYTLKELDDAFWQRFRGTWPLLLTIGLALGIHFGSWGWSVAHTSLLDSLLLVCTTPLLLVVIMTFRWLYRSQCGKSSQSAQVLLQRTPKETDSMLPTTTDDSWFRTIICPMPSLPPTWRETVGAIVGFSGVIVLLATSTESNVHQVTLAGNCAALLGALAILVYLEGGSSCRKWMPLFIYALPVTAIAATELAIASLLFENTSVYGLGPTALFGFLGDSSRFGLAFGAASVSGLLGHTFANLAVKYVSPLLISVAVLWEPLLGSFMGYLVGVQGPPEMSTLIAAPLLLGGALLVTLGAHKAPSEPVPCTLEV